MSITKARKKFFVWVGHILMYEKSDLKQSKWSVNQLSNHVGGNSSQNSHYSLHEHTLCVQMNITFTTLISNVDLHLSLSPLPYLLTFVICCCCLYVISKLQICTSTVCLRMYDAQIWKTSTRKIINLENIFYWGWNANTIWK